MARIARLVVPGTPHHVTQRGNRRQQTFFCNQDYRAYLALLGEGCRNAGVEVWAWCLMPNHVHLILTPADPDGLRQALAEAHRRYTRRINAREDWRGYLWQGRFSSAPLDGSHLRACARYVELNPVRAGLVSRPQDWPWSSARAHLAGRGGGFLNVAALLERYPDWEDLLASGPAEDELNAIRAAERTGRPLGPKAFVEKLERDLGRPIARQKPGPRGQELRGHNT